MYKYKSTNDYFSNSLSETIYPNLNENCIFWGLHLETDSFIEQITSRKSMLGFVKWLTIAGTDVKECLVPSDKYHLKFQDYLLHGSKPCM